MPDQTIKKLIEQRRLFYILDNLTLKYQKAVIDKADKKLINDLCTGIQNILNGNIKLDNNDREKLRKYKNKLRKLISKSNLKTKRKIIQTGGFLGVLIPSLISGLTSLIANTINKD